MSRPKPPICPTCLRPAVKTNGRRIYPHRGDLAKLPFWVCETCPDTFVGCHRGTENPLGLPAGPELRRERSAVHRLLDPLWQASQAENPKSSRSDVYAYMAEGMKLSKNEMHVARFNLNQCKAALEILKTTTPDDVHLWSERKSSE